MKPLMHDPCPPQARFEEAVKVAKALATQDGPRPLAHRADMGNRFSASNDALLEEGSIGEKPDAGSSPALVKRIETEIPDVDLNDIAHAAGGESSEDDLGEILNSFELSIEEKGSLKEVGPDTKGFVGAKGESELALRRGSSNAERTPSANPSGPPSREDLPSLRFIVGLIALAETAAALVLALALASWLSVHPLNSASGTLMDGLFELSSLARSTMNDAAASIFTGVRGSSVGVEMLAEPPNPSPELSVADKHRSAQQNGARVPDPPPSKTNPDPFMGSDAKAPAGDTAGPDNPVDNRSAEMEHPGSASDQASAYRSSEFEPPSLPENPFLQPVIPHETGRPQPIDIDFTSSISAPSPQSSSSPPATMNQSAAAERPEASIRSLAILRDQAQALRSRAERELRTKLALSQEATRQSDPQAAAISSQEAPQSVLPPRFAPIPASSSSRERHLLQRAELLLENSDISGARLILEKAVADGSARAAYLLAQTYDPRMLQDKWSVRGIKGDHAKAQDLYSRAHRGGVHTAEEASSH